MLAGIRRIGLISCSPKLQAGNPRVDLASTAKSHDLAVIRARELSPSVSKVRMKRMRHDRVAADKNVSPGLDVPIPENLPHPHTSPGATKKAGYLDYEWQVQPEDHVSATRDEITHFALTRSVDHP